MAGMRVGVVHSENRDLVQALDQLGAFHGVPGLTQYQMAQLFRDRGTHIFFLSLLTFSFYGRFTVHIFSFLFIMQD